MASGRLPMRVELRESGGIANLTRQLLLEDNRVFFRDREHIQFERDLGSGEAQTIADLVRQLQKARPKRFYGRRPVSDASTLYLSIMLDSEATTTEVVTDPTDPPPKGLWELVHALHRLAGKPTASVSQKDL